MSIHTHYKQPDEKYPLAVDFTGRLPTGTTILSGTCTATDEAGADASATVLDGACTVNGASLQQTMKAGLNGQRYDVRFKATLTPGALVLEEDLALFVREA